MYFIYVQFAFLSGKECHLLLKAFHQVWLLSKVLSQVNLFFNYYLEKMKQSKRHFNNFYFYRNHSDHFLCQFIILEIYHTLLFQLMLKNNHLLVRYVKKFEEKQGHAKIAVK